MSVVLFGGEKGGTGKTTLATNMAAMLALQGKDVLLLDTDRQGTASFWAAVREETEVEPRISCVQKFGKGLAAQIRDLAGRYDEIIIDAGGRDSMELRYSLGVCDRVYIPVQPFQFDIWTIQQMDELVEMAQSFNENLQAFIVLNRVSTNPAVHEDQEAQNFFEEEDYQYLSMADSFLRDRIAFRKSARGGLSVVEWKQDKKAVQEITQLFEEVYGGK
ncbi:chromosome partitioning protein ParA [Desulfolithobacter dissulfuricans]|uniref:Chromosome partitioning protein ParA n=1 Tax=Desulfolithobacter dissulfuricans TaxID=2795293 RepID=A0A915U1D5_9BACT|nr:AAA family ATPase [Desulfolithobacter dissulfuricans]BCO09294.1 chromosome partitioning protein ParA [Desulfolithobacter dissulfuricans]